MDASNQRVKLMHGVESENTSLPKSSVPHSSLMQTMEKRPVTGGQTFSLKSRTFGYRRCTMSKRVSSTPGETAAGIETRVRARH